MDLSSGLTRRQVLGILGKTAGATVMYHAMTSLGFAAETPHSAANFSLQGAPKGKSVLILGAGVAGMTAAYELRRAGYTVKILEFREKAGGRVWTLRGGDVFTELGGATQKVGFDSGLYLNPGPWRIPYHHHAILAYAKKFGVQLEPFVQVNYNAFVHNTNAYGGKPQRYRTIQADYQGHIAELLAKSVNQGALDQELTAEDKEKLLDSISRFGALDKKTMRYVASEECSMRRGFDIDPGGGLMPEQKFSQPLPRKALIESRLWRYIASGQNYEFQSAIFQPVGGMDMIAQAFAKQLKGIIRFNAKVTSIQQSTQGVTVSYEDIASPGTILREAADYCVCTIPLSVLSQIPMNVNARLTKAIRSVPYDSSVKIGLQFKRRFWEEDEHIYGGISYTNTPISTIGYPACDYGKPGKGVLLGAYIWGPNAYEFTSMLPEQRVMKALEFGALIHPQYKKEFDTGVSVGWHRVPWTHGCYGLWTEETREKYYNDLCAVDNRIVLAGEHASFIPAWQEGAVLSAQDAITRLHSHILAQKT
ncbi:MAG: flavin monoamine oxidase family protein [Zoogloeaceae bacterium]|jgi:monoamine oxidase|nr:flavin monoamine oxidase family protein [Zoogloeaceae bacterium]